MPEELTESQRLRALKLDERGEGRTLILPPTCDQWMVPREDRTEVTDPVAVANIQLLAMLQDDTEELSIDATAVDTIVSRAMRALYLLVVGRTGHVQSQRTPCRFTAQSLLAFEGCDTWKAFQAEVEIILAEDQTTTP